MLSFTKFLIKTTGTALAVLGTVVALSEGANAANLRPVQFGTSKDNPGDNGCPSDYPNCSLQTIFDKITVGTPDADRSGAGIGIDAVKDQKPFDLFTNTSSGGSVASFIVEFAGFASKNTFGLYQLNNPGVRAELFKGSNDSGDQSFLSFLDNGDLEVITRGRAPDNNKSNSIETYEGFGNQFGFYLTTPEKNTFYSEDRLNPNGSAHALLYQGDDKTTLRLPGKQAGLFTDNEFIVAFEDKVNYDNDYNDAVVLIESIHPVTPSPSTSVPEPASLLGLGAVSTSFLGFRRRQSKGKKTTAV